MSPMPFGSDPFRDPILARIAPYYPAGSPMPFGSDPFRDRELDEVKKELALSHQCLSAVIPFGTRSLRLKQGWGSCSSPMPFGSDPFRDQAARL